jgi:hypothetical protein
MTTTNKHIFENNKNENICCSNHPICKIIYNFGTKWSVCEKCLKFEEFSSDIKEKMEISS